MVAHVGVCELLGVLGARRVPFDAGTCPPCERFEVVMVFRLVTLQYLADSELGGEELLRFDVLLEGLAQARVRCTRVKRHAPNAAVGGVA
jgi:hypothetical protein